MNKTSKFQPCSSLVSCIKFLSKNSDFIVCGNYVGNISLFSTKSNENVWTNKDSAGNTITSVAVSPSYDILAGGGEKKCLFVINAANGESICSVDVDSSIWRVLFLSQQKVACGFANGTVAIVCWKTQKIEKILKIGRYVINALAKSPVNNDILLTGDNAGVIKQTIISSEKTVMMYEGHTKVITDLSIFSCGNFFVSGSWDQTARLFAIEQKQAIRVFKGHSGWVRSVSLIHEDELLTTTSLDNIVKLWKIESGECLFTMEANQSVWCGDVSKDDRFLVLGGGNGAVTLFSCPPRFAVSLDRKLKLCC